MYGQYEAALLFSDRHKAGARKMENRWSLIPKLLLKTMQRKPTNITTANVRYYVKEKEPEPGAVRKGTSQPELDARSHEEVIPRNDAAEKQNEIPGRQIPSQTDPLVEIRSAVHSNYAGMVAMLGADNRVYLGREERCHYQNMQPSYYDNQDGSCVFVC